MEEVEKQVFDRGFAAGRASELLRGVEKFEQGRAQGFECGKAQCLKPIQFQALTKDEIKGKLGRADSEHMQATLALVAGLKAESEMMLIEADRPTESAEVWRGQLRACVKFERLLNGLWDEMDEDSRRMSKTEKAGG